MRRILEAAWKVVAVAAVLAATLIVLLPGALGWSLAVLVGVAGLIAGFAWRPIAANIVEKLATEGRGFTYVNEGTAMFVMRGGQPVHTLVQWGGHYLDEEGNVVEIGYHIEDEVTVVEDGSHLEEKIVVKDGFHLEGDVEVKDGYHLDGGGNLVEDDDYNPENGPTDDTELQRQRREQRLERLQRPFPVWFGAWFFENPLVNALKIFQYDWRRTVVDERGQSRELSDTGENGVYSVPLQRDVYWAQVTGAESKDLIPMNVELLITAQIINPVKAIFHTGAKPGVWLQVIIASMEGEVTPIMSEEVFDDWIKDPASVGDKLFKRLQGPHADDDEADVETPNDIVKQFEEIYGVRIIAIRGLKVDPDSAYRELTTAFTKAEKEGQAEVARAEKQAEALLKRAEGFRAAGEAGRVVLLMETLEKSKVGANLLMMMPDLQAQLRTIATEEDREP